MNSTFCSLLPAYNFCRHSVQFDLWCVSPFYRSLSGIFYMVGMMVGAITLGDLADRIGRRVSCWTCLHGGWKLIEFNI